MKTIAVLLDQSSVNHKHDLKPLMETTLSKLQGICDTVYSMNAGPELPGVQNLSFNTSNEFMQWVSELEQDTEVLALNACSPLLDVASTQAMLDEHRRLAFDFSYPENIPLGLLPEIMNSGIAQFILNTLPASCPLFNKSVMELFESDLSSYDTNIFISPCKLIQYRLEFIPSSENNLLVMQNIIAKYGSDKSMLDLEAALEADPSVMRGRPSFYEIQLTTEREKGELFLSDLSQREGIMDLDLFKDILKQIDDFSWNPVVMLGFHGEPFVHPHIDDIISEIAQYPRIRFIFETRCLMNRFEAVEAALKLPHTEIIFDLSFVQPEPFARYKASLSGLHTPLPLPELEQKIQSLEPKSRIFPQLTRSTINEEELFKFYQKWRDYSVVIQRLDTFNGAHQHLQVVDLAPIKKSFCFHLKHDVLILSDGTVALNRYDVDGIRSPGHIQKDGLPKVWDRMGELYQRQWDSGFTDTEAGCDYDGWWVFNF